GAAEQWHVHAIEPLVDQVLQLRRRVASLQIAESDGLHLARVEQVQRREIKGKVGTPTWTGTGEGTGPGGGQYWAVEDILVEGIGRIGVDHLVGQVGDVAPHVQGAGACDDRLQIVQLQIRDCAVGFGLAKKLQHVGTSKSAVAIEIGTCE